MQTTKILTEKLINFRAASRHFVLKTFIVYIYSYWHIANKNNRLIQLFLIHQQFRSCIVLYDTKISVASLRLAQCVRVVNTCWSILSTRR
jgi:hypothetical protein